jgi:NADH dehydrogenase FAD-containing subunit
LAILLIRKITYQAGVIYDGRVIVDGFFQTNDNSIFATGSVAKFSRKCSKHLPKLDKFCSKEAGKALAETMFNLVTIHSPTNGKVICPWEVLLLTIFAFTIISPTA